MNITLVITTLSSGGAERVLILLAKGLLEKGHNVSVITLYGETSDFYSLPEGVKRTSLNLGGPSSGFVLAIRNNLKLIRGLRKGILGSRPHVVIPFMDKTNIITLISMIGSKIPVIVTEHNDPRMMPIGNTWSKLRRLFYPQAQKLISVSKGVDKHFSWIDNEKRAVIYNPLPEEDLAITEGETIKVDAPYTLVSMGRLDYQKGYDLLIQAFAKLRDKFPQWQLVILGEGEERGTLEKMVIELRLEGVVKLPGRLKNPFPTLRQVDAFVLSSRFEGFGNVLIEAMACGLPVISTDCPSGPGEIIQNGENGILVESENINALAAGLERLMSDQSLREFLKLNALKSVDKYKLENIMKSWEEVLNDVTSL